MVTVMGSEVAEPLTFVAMIESEYVVLAVRPLTTNDVGVPLPLPTEELYESETEPEGGVKDNVTELVDALTNISCVGGFGAVVTENAVELADVP